MNSISWMEDKEEEEYSASWTQNNININNNNNCDVVVQNRDNEMGNLTTLKSMLEVEDDWYITSNIGIQNHSDIRDITFSTNLADPDGLLMHSVDSSSSCSPSSSMFNNLDPSQVQYFLPPKPTLFSLLNAVSNNPLDHSYDLGCELGLLDTQAPNNSSMINKRSNMILSSGLNDFSSLNQMGPHNLSSSPQFSTNPVPQGPQMSPNNTSFSGFRAFDVNSENALFQNRSKLLRPLDSSPSTGAQPTLFQKRAALREKLSDNGSKLGGLGSNGFEGAKGKKEMEEDNEKRRKFSSGDGMDDVTIDGSGLNYDSDEFTKNTKVDETAKNRGNSTNAHSGVTDGDQKGKKKKKGLPAKNLMAERRRRKKLNDRLYMLRSVVPKISKMDRPSILGDAIEYLKELLQRINDLHNELESTPPGSSLTPTTSLHPLTTTAHKLQGRIKEELCPSSLPSPNGQPARVEVRVRDGRALNIHMFCGQRPGLLLSTMRALDNLGLDVQQAVISCFNGFAMDIFRAEQRKEGQVIHPEHIKAILLDSAGFHGMI